MNGESKWIGYSKTAIGLAITVLSALAPVLGPLVGIEVTANDIQTIGGQILNAVQVVGTAVGTLLALFGRKAAAQPVHFIPKPLIGG